jgi:hypothetical protein
MVYNPANLLTETNWLEPSGFISEEKIQKNAKYIHWLLVTYQNRGG